MLSPLDAWVDRLAQMSPAQTPIDGAKNLADFYGDMADQAQGGPLGSPGILTFNRALFATTLAPQFSPNPAAPTWASTIATAWQVALAASIITPGTVTNPAWVTSSVDVVTIPIGAASIITLPVAKNLLMVGLIASAAKFQSSEQDGQKAFAKAFLDATNAFVFLTIGLGPLAVPIPLPTPVL